MRPQLDLRSVSSREKPRKFGGPHPILKDKNLL